MTLLERFEFLSSFVTVVEKTVLNNGFKKPLLLLIAILSFIVVFSIIFG